MAFKHKFSYEVNGRTVNIRVSNLKVLQVLFDVEYNEFFKD